MSAVYEVEISFPSSDETLVKRIAGIHRRGADELNIMRVLALVVSHVERNYGLDLGKATN